MHELWLSLHVACGVGTAGVGEPAVGAAGTRSLQLCVGGLSCSCEDVCEQWCLQESRPVCLLGPSNM